MPERDGDNIVETNRDNSANDSDGKSDGGRRDSCDTRQVNLDEIISRIQDAPTEVIEAVKGLDANRYATKKTVAQGMLDIALLTSNASQLKYVLQVGPRHEFYTMLVTLISISIVLQVLMGVVLLTLNLLRDCRFHQPQHMESARGINYGTTAVAFVVTTLNVMVAAFDSSLARYLDFDYILLVGLLFVLIGGMDLNDHSEQPAAIILNDVIVIFIFVISVINVVISAFGIEYSNSPLASAGVLAIITASLDPEKHTKQKRIADWLYHASVGMMTCVIFCDVIKMTFGLDPALSEHDYLANRSASFVDYFYSVISALVAIILGCIFNINRLQDQKRSEILNNTNLLFKVISIAVNLIVGIFYSLHVNDSAAEYMRDSPVN